jgi:alkaline phosphatase D
MPRSPISFLDRRRFLATSTAWAAATIWASRAQGLTLKNPPLGGYPFTLGVASGDPSPEGFVLWTRLAPKPLEGGGMPVTNVAVEWVVAEDEKLAKIVQQDTATASPDWGHSVHVEVAGLKPDRWYFYQFRVGSELSPVGRTRTMPLRESTPDKLKFAFASCQHFESGLYTAYEHMLRDDLDLVCHLGDYIYEGQGTTKGVRRHVGPLLKTLDDYRNRHAQYKTDAALQAMHAAAPWLVTWDDHEFENNYANHISQHKDAVVEDFLKQRAVAYKAYYEHMPLRRSSLPKGADMLLYRSCSFGQLAEFQVLDTRQYRSDQPCGDGRKAPCAESLAETQTMLGTEQEAWLCKQLKASPAKWNVLAQQVMVGRVDRVVGEGEGYSMDQWPGYEANRLRLIKYLYEQKIANPVILTGDIHVNFANNIELSGPGDKRIPVATELVGTSISSGGNGLREPKDHAATLAENPFVKFYNSERGYVRCTVTPREWKSDYQLLDYVVKPGSPIHTRASFVTEAGKPDLQHA